MNYNCSWGQIKYVGKQMYFPDSAIVEHNRVAANKRVYYIGPMHNKTRQLLDDFYQPHRDRLAKILTDDRFLWKEKVGY